MSRTKIKTGDLTDGAVTSVKVDSSIAKTADMYSDTDVASYLSGNLDAHILPDANDTYDIGSAEYKIRDLYVSDNSIHIGDGTLSRSSGGTIQWNNEDIGGGGGGAWEVINSTVASSAASVTFSLSGYSQYKIMLFDVVIGGATTPGGSWLVMKTLNSGAVMSGFTYQWERIGASAYGTAGYDSWQEPMLAQTWADPSNVSKLGLCGEMTVIATSDGTQMKSDMTSYNNNSITRTLASARYAAATQADQITLRIAGGLTINGTFTLYGIKTS